MSRKGIRALAVLAALCLAVVSAPAEPVLTMDEVVVTATRTATPVLDSPDTVTIITAEEVAAAGAATAAEALAKTVGVDVADSGTAGSVKSVRIRGSAAGQVLVLVDGIRMNDSRQGGTDLSLLPVEMIERIEVVRTGASALYGADALGGVVNIITKNKGDRKVTLSVANGSYLPRAAVEVSEGPTQTPVAANWTDLVDTQRIGLQASGSLGLVDFLATGSFTRAANGFVWNDAQYIDDWRRQVNAALLEGSAFTSVTARDLGSGRFGFKGQFNYSSTGAPGSLTWPSTDAAQQRAALQGQLFYENPVLTGRLGMEAHVFYKLTRLAYQDPDIMFPVDDTHTLHSIGVDLQQQAAIADFLQLVYGGNFLADLADSTTIGGRRRYSGGAFLEAPFYIGELLTLTPTARYDLYSDFPGSLTWKLAAVLRLSDTFSLKAGGGKSYRAPTLNDLYWPNDGMTEGNPALLPETGYSGELGVSLMTGKLEANASAFARYVQDGIQWTEISPFFYKPMNVGEAFYPGAEASLDVELLPGLHAAGSYTFLYSFVLKGASATYTLADDKRAIYSPMHTADLAVRWRKGKTRIGADAKLVGERFTNEANTSSLPLYVVVNADAKVQLLENVALSVAGKNLLNTVYQTVNGYVMPPFSFWLGAEASY
jgi:vitamin B12 transporter